MPNTLLERYSILEAGHLYAGEVTLEQRLEWIESQFGKTPAAEATALDRLAYCWTQAGH
jgi:hypothetical protein